MNADNLRPQIEPETGAKIIATRRPATIAEGRLVGSEITAAPGGYRVWTPKTRLAREVARQHGLRLRGMNGEAELLVPSELAGAILPRFGARSRRPLTEQERDICVARLEAARLRARNASNLGFDPQKMALPPARNQGAASFPIPAPETAPRGL